MRIAILRLHQCLSFVASSLQVLLILFAQGCGPVCTGTSGSCLNLRVEGSTQSTSDYASTRLSVWLGGTDISGTPIVVSGMSSERASLPTNLLIQPPPAMGQVDTVSVQLLGWGNESDPLPSGSLLLTGRTNFSWPAGTRIEAAVNLEPPSVPPFVGRVDLPAGGDPRSFVVLDADHNGQMDLAVRNSGASGDSIFLLLANADGSFLPAQNIFPSAAVRTLSDPATADLDGDHHADLIFADAGTGMVYVLYGKGDGAFHEPTLFSSGVNTPLALRKADLDGDGRVDLLISGKLGAASVFWNEGQGVFGNRTVVAEESTTLSSVNPGAISLIDVNHDGLMDVVGSRMNASNSITIWNNDGGRVFLSPVTVDSPMTAPFVMVAQDFNGDSWVDVVTADSSSGGRLSFLKGDGSTLDARYAQVWGSQPQLALATDLNADLLPDLALTDAATVVTALGNGLGGFQPAVCPGEVCQLPGNAIFGQAHDLNGDGEPELLFVTAGEAGGTGTVSILRHASGVSKNANAPTISGVLPATAANNVPTTLTLTGANFEAGSTATVGGVACTEVNILSPAQLTCIFPGKPKACGGQSIVVTRPDGVVSSTLPTANGLWLTSAILEFAQAANFRTGATPVHFVIGDFNGDKKLDVVTANRDRGSVSVLLGNGHGELGSPKDFPIVVGPFWIRAGDFNSDKKLDLVVSNTRAQSASVLLGNGMGEFGAATNLLVGYSDLTLTIGDINNDQKLDFVTCNAWEGSVSMFLGNGMGGFGAPSTMALPVVSPTSIGAGDLNGDGYTDLVVPNAGGNAVLVLRGDGMGGLSPPVSLAANIGVGRVILADANGDHKLDIFTSASESPTASLLIGDGRGGFGAASIIPLLDWPSAFVIRDINGDGKTDLAFVSENSNGVGVLLGDGTGAFGSLDVFRANDFPVAVEVGDFNGDGLIDLATVSYRNSEVSILLQQCE